MRMSAIHMLLYSTTHRYRQMISEWESPAHLLDPPRHNDVNCWIWIALCAIKVWENDENALQMTSEMLEVLIGDPKCDSVSSALWQRKKASGVPDSIFGHWWAAMVSRGYPLMTSIRPLLRESVCVSPTLKQRPYSFKQTTFYHNKWKQLINVLNANKIEEKDCGWQHERSKAGGIPSLCELHYGIPRPTFNVYVRAVNTRVRHRQWSGGFPSNTMYTTKDNWHHTLTTTSKHTRHCHGYETLSALFHLKSVWILSTF